MDRGEEYAGRSPANRKERHGTAGIRGFQRGYTVYGAERESWRRNTTIEAGDEQSFVLFAINGKQQYIIFKSAGEPLGMLGYDRWRVRIIVTSDDGQGFEGELRFTYTRGCFLPDDPAFHRIRTIPPLVRQKSSVFDVRQLYS
jgi:hypothetical protein